MLKVNYKNTEIKFIKVDSLVFLLLIDSGQLFLHKVISLLSPSFRFSSQIYCGDNKNAAVMGNITDIK